VADQIETFCWSDFRALSDEELKAKTPEFQQSYQNGKNILDDLYLRLFASCSVKRKACAWVVSLHVQLMGGVTLHRC